MVKLNKIYTRTGDDGTTGLGTGARVLKDDTRVEAYGTVDEANAALGLAIELAISVPTPPAPGSVDSRILILLKDLQHDLFDVGADLCMPITNDEKPGAALRILPEQVDRLETHIDAFNEHLPPLTSFVLPGGTGLATGLHVARTIVRRAERLTVTLCRIDPEATSPVTVRYLNRLSDLLFVLARASNAAAGGDVLWVPGATRNR